jgi:hypothetical protein
MSSDPEEIGIEHLSSINLQLYCYVNLLGEKFHEFASEKA